MSDYQQVKNHVFYKLRNLQVEKNLLEQSDIDQEIIKMKTLLSIDEDIKELIFHNRNISMKDEDFYRLQDELEKSFDVKMEKGIEIQGIDQKNRDTTWWTSYVKQNNDNYYWSRYKKLLEGSFSDKVIKTIDIDTDIIMNNLENPSIKKFHIYGMSVGHVQSGKTSNYASLVCKAADAGYRFIVIIAGGLNNLRDQTQERINESFIGKDNKGNQIGVGIGNLNREKLPISLTTIERDFNKQDADRNSQGNNFDNTSSPIVVVIKKNSHTLTNIIDWLKNQYKNKIEDHAVLMIDDESDYASINTKEKEDPTPINKKIRELLALFNKSCYVAYTATPYANIFIDYEVNHNELGVDLFPKDFIYVLDAPSNYFGAQKIFIENPDKYLIEIEDCLGILPLKHKKDVVLSELPESLLEAVRLFVINIAIRALRGQSDKHNSMMVHITRYTLVHQQVALLVEHYLVSIKNDIQAFGRLYNPHVQSTIIMDLKNTYNERVDGEIEKFTWIEVLNVICEYISSVVVREVHQNKKKIPLEYKKNRATNVIVVGGTSIARGFTLEGLSISYFLRSTIFYDTLMQMGRWFGYRDGYEDLCKIYTTREIIDNFTYIIESTDDLIKDFNLMSEVQKTPNDFGLAIRQHPDSLLQITAKNKQKNVHDFVFDMKLDGQSKETNWISNRTEDKLMNLAVIDKIITTIEKRYSKRLIGRNVLWEGVERGIISNFLSEYRVYKNESFRLNARMPIDFIQAYVKQWDYEWDVVLFSGSGEQDEIGGIKFNREQRKATLKNNDYIEIRQISTGNAEAIALNDEKRKELGSNRKATRKELKRPLLMLHIFETSGKEKESGHKEERLAAIGLSFPGSVLTNNHTTKLKINKVYYKNLIEELALEEEADDY